MDSVQAYMEPVRTSFFTKKKGQEVEFNWVRNNIIRVE